MVTLTLFEPSRPQKIPRNRLGSPNYQDLGHELMQVELKHP